MLWIAFARARRPFVVPLFLVWRASMSAASALACDGARDVARNVREMPVPAERNAWRRAVAEPAIALERGTLVAVAKGWEKGVIGLSLFYIGFSAFVFFLGLNAPVEECGGRSPSAAEMSRPTIHHPPFTRRAPCCAVIWRSVMPTDRRVPT